MEHVKAGNWPLMAMRGVFLALLLAVVAFHGGTQAATMAKLEWALLWVSAGYAVARLATGHFDELLNPGLLWLGAILLLLGWLAALLPESAYSRDFRAFLPFDGGSWWPWASVDGDLSKTTMVRLTGLMASVMMAMNMARSALWRKSLLLTVVALGTSVVLLGLLQKGMGDVGGYWGVKKLGSAFGPFWYHGNAGAFLNLCWPLAATGAMTAISRLETTHVASQLRLALWLLAMMVMATGAFVNVSKAAQTIFLIQVVALTGVWLHQWRLSQGRSLGSGQWVTVVIFTLLIGVLLYMLGMESGLERWEHLVERNFDDGRWKMAVFLLPLAGEAGALGFGPGTFRAVYVVKSTGEADAPHGYWLFAHNDYIQTLLEWGWLGASLWVLLGISILWILFGQLRAALTADHLSTFTFKAAIFIALTGTAIHAALDFPLQIFAIQLVAACLAGLGLAPWRSSHRTKQRKVRRKKTHGTGKMNSLSGVDEG